MQLSRESFGLHALALVAALEASDDSDGNDGDRISSSSKFQLAQWKLKYYGRSDICLMHTPIYSHHHIQHDQVDIEIEDHAEEEPSLEDEAVYSDRESCYDSLVEGEQVVPQVVDTFQWNFSVVYNDTFEAPVLYFHVQHLNGEPCSRQHLLAWLKPTMEDSWEFLSQDHHPVTGHPSFFLHPCQTPSVLQTLTAASDRNILWAWLSWILRVVGHHIPPKFYLRVQNKIMQSSSK